MAFLYGLKTTQITRHLFIREEGCASTRKQCSHQLSLVFSQSLASHPCGSLRHGVHSFNNRLCVFLRHTRFCTVQYQRKSQQCRLLCKNVLAEAGRSAGLTILSTRAKDPSSNRFCTIARSPRSMPLPFPLSICSRPRPTASREQISGTNAAAPYMLARDTTVWWIQPRTLCNPAAPNSQPT